MRTKGGDIMILMRAEQKDLQEILDLQYIAYQSESKLLNNSGISPLKQTLQEVQYEYEKGVFLKAKDDGGSIIGSVRAYSENDTLYIGKLIVRPDLQGQGIGTNLLNEIEKVCPHPRYELFTSSKSIRNIKLYKYLGYEIFKEQDISEELKFIYLQKLS